MAMKRVGFLVVLGILLIAITFPCVASINLVKFSQVNKK